jgi:hypothetical protein
MMTKIEIINNIGYILTKFAEDTDVDGRETLYQFTDKDLDDLKEQLINLIEKGWY